MRVSIYEAEYGLGQYLEDCSLYDMAQLLKMCLGGKWKVALDEENEEWYFDLQWSDDYSGMFGSLGIAEEE